MSKSLKPAYHVRDLPREIIINAEHKHGVPLQEEAEEETDLHQEKDLRVPASGCRETHPFVTCTKLNLQ